MAWPSLTVSISLLAGLAIAQVSSGPCPQTVELERTVATQRRQLNDWGGLIRYGSENTEIPKPVPGEERVVFLGDEITEQWGQGSTPFFSGKRYFNRGIRGQTSAQMLVRFRQDVISLRP